MKHFSSHNPHVMDILNEMSRFSLERKFLISLMRYCQQYEGITALMHMWFEESNAHERDKIIADLQESIDDIVSVNQGNETRPRICFEDINEIRKDVVEFKKKLREEVDRQGGMSAFARKTGIPQPSLSRFFNSKSMPHRTTLYEIAKALNLPASAVGFKWNR